MEVMRVAVARQYFEEAVFSGATYAPQDAAARGFVHEIVEPDRLLERALAAAQTLAALPAKAFALSKRQIRGPALQRMADKEVAAAIERIWTAPETLASIRAYVARTLRKS
jgi:enoyl-CoA hydratase